MPGLASVWPPSSNGLLWVCLLTALFEAVTIALRWGADLQSTRDTRFLRPLTRGLRIHHCYLGAGLGFAALLLPVPAPFRAWTFWVGVALIASDLIHHFLVLWPITGSHEFHVVYPEAEPVRVESR